MLFFRHWFHSVLFGELARCFRDSVDGISKPGKRGRSLLDFVFLHRSEISRASSKTRTASIICASRSSCGQIHSEPS
jgi:hypothetical protein